MRTPTWIFCYLIAALAFASPARPGNLVTNAEFDYGYGLDLWNPQFGTWDLVNDSGGCSNSEAAEGSSATQSGSLEYLGIQSEQCFPVDATSMPTLSVGALHRSSAQVNARLSLSFFSDEACVTQLQFSDETIYSPSSASWNHLHGEIPILVTAGSVKLFVDFLPVLADLPPFTASLDRMYLGVEPEILIDGFEAGGGSRCRWSSTTG